MTGATTEAVPRLIGADLPAQQWLALLAVATLPFTYALTVDLRFPLKIYELTLALTALYCVASGRVRAALGAWRAAAPVLWLAAWAALTLGYRVARPLSSVGGDFEARFGPAGDGITKVMYLALAVFGFAVCSYAAQRDARLFCRVWVAGALVAAAYAWYLFASSALDAEPLLLPGMKRPQIINVGTWVFIRSGTFEEGNYFGLFLVCSTAAAWYGRMRAAAAALSVTVLITFSTVNVVAAAILWGGLAWSAVRAQRGAANRGAALMGTVLLAALLVAALVATGYVSDIVLAKLTGPETVSKFERAESAVAGLRMFADHPVAGVGISQYGYNYKAYQLTDLFERYRNGKSIANNVYVELLSELGVVGLALFGAFLWRLFRATRAPGLHALRWGLVAVLFALNAFPTYTQFFVWGYAALIVGAAARAAGDGAPA